jgi:hypothetical protein
VLSLGALSSLGAVSLVVGCASGGPAGGSDWRRAFFASPERVHDVALEVLAELDYEILEDDVARGRIRAENTRGGPARAIVLELSLTEGQEWVRVDIVGRATSGTTDLTRLEQAAFEVLGEMADRLPSA